MEKIEKTDRAVGEKALRLSELLREKLPVPAGFVINSEGLLLFMKKNQLEERIANLLSDLDVEDYRRLTEVSNEIRNLFSNSEIPDTLKNEISNAYESLLVSREAKEVGGPALDFIKAGREQTNVAVRPSPAAHSDSSFIGQTESALNIQGLGNLLESIKFCWSSLYTPRAIYYKKKRELPDITHAGVVVQRMVDAEKSGSIFADNSNVIIEGTWGLGNAISNGIILPDIYRLDMETGEEVEKRVGRKLWIYTKDPISGKTKKEAVLREKVNAQLLGSEEIKKIFEMYKRVSSMYAQPQAVGWGIERNKIFLLHTRPLPRTEGGEGTENEKECVAEGLDVSKGSVKGSIKIVSSTSDFERISEGDILVTKVLSPELFPFFSKVRGVVSDYGGYTSSLSFMCREFGIPCITGLDTSSLSEGMVVNINNGKLYSMEGYASSGTNRVDEGGVTATEIKLNLDLSKDFDLEKDVDGVGLLKAEGLFTGRDPFSLSKTNPEELVELLCQIGSFARKFYPKTVWYRSFSLRSDEIEGEWREKNPLLGWRGVRRSLEEPEILRCEIEAIRRLYAQGLNNIGIVLSFVTTAEEFRMAKTLVPFSLKLGIEVCTPSSALDIESFCREGVNNVLINLPELTQLTLGVDRTNVKVSSFYSESHPSVMKLIENILSVCMQYNVEVSVSIERYEPDVLEKLIRMGVGAISLDPEFVDMGKNLVARVEKRIMLDNVRKSENSQAA